MILMLIMKSDMYVKLIGFVKLTFHLFFFYYPCFNVNHIRPTLGDLFFDSSHNFSPVHFAYTYVRSIAVNLCVIIIFLVCSRRVLRFEFFWGFNIKFIHVRIHVAANRYTYFESNFWNKTLSY